MTAVRSLLRPPPQPNLGPRSIPMPSNLGTWPWTAGGRRAACSCLSSPPDSSNPAFGGFHPDRPPRSSSDEPPRRRAGRLVVCPPTNLDGGQRDPTQHHVVEGLRGLKWHPHRPISGQPRPRQEAAGELVDERGDARVESMGSTILPTIPTGAHHSLPAWDMDLDRGGQAKALAAPRLPSTGCTAIGRKDGGPSRLGAHHTMAAAGAPPTPKSCRCWGLLLGRAPAAAGGPWGARADGPIRAKPG